MINKTSYKRQKWQLANSDKAAIDRLVSELGMPDWQIQLLNQRQLSTAEQINNFLYPALDALPSPFLFEAMERAVTIIKKVMKSKSPLVIMGDYDVDGVTGVALLARFFTALEVGFTCLHPDRFSDGYGLKANLVLEIYENPGLVITVDCGISDAGEVKILQQKGWQVIITDHHQPPLTCLPPADAILNPWLKDCSFPFKDLAGVGVAFYLAMGIRNYLAQENYWPTGKAPNLRKILDLVAVGTIADMVTLQGVNRILAKAGLEVISQKSNEGLQELTTLSSPGKLVNSEDISFQIAPRLNAAGRMGAAGRASELLLTEDRAQARKIAAILDRENQQRKSISSDIVNEAISLANEKKKGGHCLILHNSEWHEGLIGIAASKLARHFHKPTIILTGKEILKGSARSVEGVNIHEILSRCKDLLIAYGGHRAAAGLTIKVNQLAEFVGRVEEYIEEIWNEEIGTPVQLVNLSINKNVKIPQLIKFNQLLQPFGQGNPEPVYCTDNSCCLRNIKLIGKDRNHIRFDALINGEWQNAIGFGFGKDAFNYLVDRTNGCQIAFHLQYNSFRGQNKIQLQLVDFIVS